MERFNSMPRKPKIVIPTSNEDVNKYLAEMEKKLGTNKEASELISKLKKIAEIQESAPKKKAGRPKGTTKPKKEEETFIHKISDGSKPKSRKRIVDGREEGVYTRSEPISINIKFVDPGTDRDDKVNKKLKKFTKRVVQQGRTDRRIELVCEGGCNRTFKVDPIFAAGDKFICNDCIIKKGKSNAR